jgi:a component of the cytoplasm (encore)
MIRFLFFFSLPLNFYIPLNVFCRYKTQSVRSDSITPSPTGYGSDDHTPEPVTPSCGVVWAVTDIASVPRGSVLIDPQTLQPIVNQDG